MTTKTNKSLDITTTTGEHDLPDGKVSLLGAIDSVTPASTLLDLAGTQILVDCGVTPGETLDFRALGARALILTHAHFDHVGGLPELLAAGRISRLYATRPTLEITRTLIKDSIRLKGGGNADYLRFKDNLKRVERSIAYGESFTPVDGQPVEAVLREAGHILGSASVEFTSPESRVIVSGDLGRPDSPILRDYNTSWSADKPVDLVLMESTYGGRVQEYTPASLEDQLESIIKQALRDGGHILVPTFAIGRTQVLLYLLNNLVESGRLENLPVAVDTPMGLQVTDTYKKFQRLYDKEATGKINNGDDPIDFDSLYSVRRHRDSRRLDELTRPMLIIAGSGMCTGGRIAGHMIELLHKPETNVILVGYQAPGTPGAALQEFGFNRKGDESTNVEILGEQVEVRAAIDTLKGISAHADQKELKAWLDAIPGVKKVALYHGDEEAQKSFKEYCEKS